MTREYGSLAPLHRGAFSLGRVKIDYVKRGGFLQRRTPLKAKSPSLKRTPFKVKPSAIRTAKRKTWQAVSRFVRARDPYCVTCLMAGKKVPSTEAGHYKHTTDKANAQLGGNMVWYDARNLNGQCSTCNRWNSGELDLYGLYLEKKHGYGICQELHALWLTSKKWTLADLEEIRTKFEGATNFIHKPTQAALQELPV